MQPIATQRFQQTVYDYYARSGRHDLLWRSPASDGGFDPYKILVSELMLQQTQVRRVIPKYFAFLDTFPDVQSLAAAPLGAVLKAWNGLGYNRRAKFLHGAARAIVHDFGGVFPASQVELATLPGVGPNTAGAIVAYAFNRPAVFVETNIRTVFIHHFFKDAQGVSDKAILELAAATLDTKQPRIWYWALMDYGSFLKQTVGNLSRASTAYAKQSPFQGSRRQIRGQVVRLLSRKSLTLAALQASIPDNRLPSILDELAQEGLVTKESDRFRL